MGTTGLAGSTITNGANTIVVTGAGTAPPANGSARGTTATMNGVTQVQLMDTSGNVYSTIAAADLTIAATGVSITLSNVQVDAATFGTSPWNNSGGVQNRFVRFTTATGQTSDSATIIMAP